MMRREIHILAQFTEIEHEFTNTSVLSNPQNKRNWGRNKGWCKACFKMYHCTFMTCLASRFKSNGWGNVKLNNFENSKKILDLSHNS